MIIKKIGEFLKKNWRACILLGIAGIFFIGASAYNFYVQKPAFYWGNEREFIKWTSPDETANYILAKLYGQEKKLYFFEKYNLATQDIIRPRSFRSDYGLLKPVSFLGLPILYGTAASLTSYEVIPYLTPLLAAIGIIFYYLLVKEIFDRRVALFSSILLACFPVYVYYSARSMFHNVGFTVFFVMALYFFVKSRRVKELLPPDDNRDPSIFLKFLNKVNWGRLLFTALAGILFGLAISFRTSELLWLGPLMLILFIISIKRLNIYLLNIVLFVVLALLPMLSWNQILYGSFFNGGYPEMNSSIGTIGQAGSALLTSGMDGDFKAASGMLQLISETVFHFGIKLSQSLKLFYFYVVEMFEWIIWPAAVGLMLFLSRFWKIKKYQWVYLAGLIFIAAILVIYYGSWEFYDNPNKAERTIGNSYTRYWLPIYLGIIPFAAFLLDRFLLIFKGIKPLRIILALGFVCYLSYLSISFVLYGSDEGLVPSAQRAAEAQAEYKDVMEATESNSVIITRYHDKLFFPERKVVLGEFDDNNMIDQYVILAKDLPVYYYNFNLPKGSVDYLNQRRLKSFGLNIEKVKQVRDDFTLYRLTPVK